MRTCTGGRLRGTRRRGVAVTLAVAVALAGGACGRVGFDRTALVGRDGGADGAVTMDAGERADGAPSDGGHDAGTDASAADAGACPESPCRLVVEQCGCGAGEMCMWQNRRGPRACVVAGVVAAGDACTADRECVPGSGCVRTGRTGPGQCLAYCDASRACATGEVCVRIDWSGAVGVCSRVCDPVAGGPCPAGLKCGISQAFDAATGAAVAAGFCTPIGTGVLGAVCSEQGDCGVGLACASGQCFTSCVVGTTACTCLRNTPPTSIAGVEYGTCL